MKTSKTFNQIHSHIEYIPLPDCQKRPRNCKPDLIVLHWDAAASVDSCLETLRQRGLSIHFTIDRDGTVRQHVPIEHMAYHAAPFNSRSIGIEINGASDHKIIKVDDQDAASKFQKIQDGNIFHEAKIIEPLANYRTGFFGTYTDFTAEQKQAALWLVRELAGFLELPNITLPGLKNAGKLPNIEKTVSNSVCQSELKNGTITCCGHYHIKATKIDPGITLMNWLANQDGVELSK